MVRVVVFFVESDFCEDLVAVFCGWVYLAPFKDFALITVLPSTFFS